MRRPQTLPTARARVQLRGARTALLVSLLAAFAIAGPAVASSAAATVQFGYGDQTATMFTDPQWQALDLRDVRRNVDWDTPAYPAKVRDLDAWMAAAKLDGSAPLLAIDHSTTPGKASSAPTAARYRALVLWLRGRYPWWNTLTPWNEANFRLQPTYRKPQLAASYWKIAKASCSGCTVTSPVILGWAGAPKSWIPAFQKATGGKVTLWAVHVYADQNRLKDSTLTALEHQLKGTLWVTEAAGWVSFLGTRWPFNEQRAARATSYVFAAANKHRARVARWYFYQWLGAAPGSDSRWDSGVMNADDTPRPGYRALVTGLQHFH